MAKKRVGILISGRGSNMAALVEAARDPAYPAEIAVVISNRPQAPGLEIARAQGIPTLAIDHKALPSREAFDEAANAALVERRIELVCLAGFMRIQSERFVERWLGRQLNIHPSLLPAFKGLNPQQQALDAGVRISGATVHFVTPELDSGPIVAQAAVPVLDSDTAESLSARILAAEHKLYPLAVRLVASGAARLEDTRISLPSGAGTAQLISPDL
jgi:phosphoribosylglycinamide formyltransferase-1